MRYRKSEEIENLLDRLRDVYGDHSLEPYGDWDDPTSVGFRVSGIPVTFSVLTPDDVQRGRFDIQIEKYPPGGDYLYCDPAVSLPEFLELVKLLSGPEANWPTMKLG
ncbi:MAG: hypothetical protein U0Q16_18890 [Bryobacteraceae bacterium]